MKPWYLVWLSLYFMGKALTSEAHLASDSFLQLHWRDQELSAEWELPLTNLRPLVPDDSSRPATFAEAATQIALRGLQVSSDQGVCLAKREPTAPTSEVKSAGTYFKLNLAFSCPPPVKTITLHYDLFFPQDPQHKGFLTLEHQGNLQTAIFSSDHKSATFGLLPLSSWQQFINFWTEGVWHIWQGFDHLLFLLTLLLPASLVRRQNNGKGRWEGSQGLSGVFSEVLKVVTSFTLAHSITLALATLDLVHLPSRWVESAIASSVVLSAFNNIYPVIEERRWVIAFLFGFIHGFGFANVLQDLGLPKNTLAASLLGFNLGVESGQLAIVAAVLPLLYFWRRTDFYRKWILIGGSGATAFTALLWMIERIGNLKFMPF